MASAGNIDASFFKTCCLVAAGALFGYTIVKGRVRRSEKDDQRNFNPNRLLKTEDPKAVLRFLRYKLKSFPPILERKFSRVGEDPANSKRDDDNEIRVMTWNILARSLCEPNETWKAAKEAGDWLNFRLWRTLEETIRFDCDVICLQEIDAYEEIKPYLHSLGFTSVFCPKYKSPCLKMAENIGPDGSAVFYRKDKFRIVNMRCENLKTDQELDSQVLLIVQLEHLKQSRKLTVVCLHLKSQDECFERREKQIEFVLSAVKQHLLGINSDPGELRRQAVIICGDLNGGPEEKFYEKIVKEQDLDQLVDAYSINGPKKPTLRVVRQTDDKLVQVDKTLDFMFYTKNNLQLTETLDLPPDDEGLTREQGWPNLSWPSDHISLISSFKFV